MDKYLDDYIKGLRDPSLKQGQDFLTAETALNGIKRKINIDRNGGKSKIN